MTFLDRGTISPPSEGRIFPLVIYSSYPISVPQYHREIFVPILIPGGKFVPLSIFPRATLLPLPVAKLEEFFYTSKAKSGAKATPGASKSSEARGKSPADKAGVKPQKTPSTDSLPRRHRIAPYQASLRRGRTPTTPRDSRSSKAKMKGKMRPG